MSLLAAASLAAPPAGTRLSFDVLSTRSETAPPIAAVDLLYGPKAQIAHGFRRRAGSGQWWQLEIRTTAEAGSATLCMVRGLTARDPLAGSGALDFARYQLRIPATGESLEYVDARSGRALLPAWVDWEKYFVPHPTSEGTRLEGARSTCQFLGHVLILQSVKTGVNWERWPAVKRLELDREMLVGTGRNFKDVEGHRLAQTPQARNYTYTNFTAADYQTMIGAGMNLFTVAPDQQRWVQSEPVFFLRSAAGNPPLDYPADLYRANYLGAAMFVDEPASIMTWDRTLGPKLKHLSDVTALIEKRTALTFETNTRHYGRYWLEQQLRDRRVNLGDLRLAQVELPVWETYYDRAFYEMKGGGSGIVHEGRYRLQDFDEAAARITGQKHSHTVRQMLQWYYAPLRGGARVFGKFWGTSIYGQCDPAVAPKALEVA